MTHSGDGNRKTALKKRGQLRPTLVRPANCFPGRPVVVVAPETETGRLMANPKAPSETASHVFGLLVRSQVHPC